jgi:hypothetical protein
LIYLMEMVVSVKDAKYNTVIKWHFRMGQQLNLFGADFFFHLVSSYIYYFEKDDVKNIQEIFINFIILWKIQIQLPIIRI